MTPAERRAYVDTSRRSQPLAELERKARKARRRRPWAAMEENDLSLAKSHGWRAQFLANWPERVTGYCCLCSAFGVWDHEQKRYVAGPLHAVRCHYAPDDGPYPGWSAAGRQRPQERADMSSARAA